MYPFLSIVVGDIATHIKYVVDGHVIVAHVHPVGYKQIEQEGMNAVARSKFLDGVLYTLEFISLSDRIPTDFRVTSARYAPWIGEAFEKESYTQFYTDGASVNVTLEDTEAVPLFYARHSKTIHSFKV